MSHRDSFSAFEQEIADRDLLSSYIAFRGNEERIEGVIEVYSDVTPFLAKVGKTQWQVFVGVALVLALLYMLLYLVVRRAKQIIIRQEQELTTSLARVEETNQLLDQRVQAHCGCGNQSLEGRSPGACPEENLRLFDKVFENTIEELLIPSRAERSRGNTAFSEVAGPRQKRFSGRRRGISVRASSSGFLPRIPMGRAEKYRSMEGQKSGTEHKSGEIIRNEKLGARDSQGRLGRGFTNRRLPDIFNKNPRKCRASSLP
jgi:hypothetical protein